MHFEARLLAFESWMEAAVSGAAWDQSLRVSATLLEARHAAAIWTDIGGDGSTLITEPGSPPEFAHFCTEVSSNDRSGTRYCENVGQVTWVQVRADAGVDGELSLFALDCAALDAGLTREIATVAARAIAIRTKLSSVRATSALKSAAFDQLPFGMVIVDRQVRIAESNEACRALLARADGLSANQDRLVCREQPDQAALTQAVDRALSGELGAAVLKVHRTCGAQPYVVRVVAPGGEIGALDHCLLMIVDPDDEPAPGSEIWRAMFDLTDCELIIAEGLVSGRRITEIASQRGVSIETVRSQTKRMFERLNVSSQAEAAARLSRSAPFKFAAV